MAQYNVYSGAGPEKEKESADQAAPALADGTTLVGSSPA
jgi:hypothetical protein